jgi:hypothetical protein
LRIYPGSARGDSSHRCRATLLERRNGRGRRVWMEQLVNEVAPNHALIRDDGHFVVTLDEFRRGGAAHAVVIYDRRGRLRREFSLRALLRDKDWQNVKVRHRAIEWLPEATFAFVDQPPQFVIQLEWGRQVRIDLENLEVVRRVEADGDHNASGTPRAEADPESAIPGEVLALLAATTSAPAAEALPADEFWDNEVQRALAHLQQLAEVSGLEIEGLVREQSAQAEQAAAGKRARQAIPSEGVQSGPSDADVPGVAGKSARTNVPVPAADPRQPADYLAWLNEQTLTDGPSAAPLYQAAMEAHVKWEGDRELLSAALEGDSVALASAEITAWLEANQEALRRFREASYLDYRGLPMDSENGTLISVLLPHLSPMRELSKVAVVQAKQLEAEGEVDAAMGCYLDAMAAGAHAGRGPLLIENLVGIAMQGLVSESLLDSMAEDAGSEIDYLKLADQLQEAAQPVRPLAETLQFERAMVLDLVQRAYEWDPETRRYRVSEEGLREFGQAFSAAGAQDHPGEMAIGFMLGFVGYGTMATRTNRHYDAMTEAAEMPYREGQQAFAELEAELEDPAFRFRNPLLHGLLPALSRAAHVSVRGEATRRATRLVANLRAHRQRHGAYPDSLDVLGDSDMVIDPFTDEYFVYRRQGDDFILYSLAGNGVDDGGVHDRRGDENDIVYWPRPPRE